MTRGTNCIFESLLGTSMELISKKKILPVQRFHLFIIIFINLFIFSDFGFRFVFGKKNESQGQ